MCEKKAMRIPGVLDKTFAVFEEQSAWLSAHSLVAAQGNGKVLGYINLLVRRFVGRTEASFVMVGKLP